MNRRVRWLVATAGLLAIALRLVALEADAYRGLSWDTGLFSDEGFYLHNARNLVLFGQTQTDDFNNRLLMPLLHAIQVAVFKLFGVGMIQTRSISVVFSLITLPIFWCALRRAFSVEVAHIGTLFLGLDHINLFYNRMGLMDTPAAFVMVCAFYALVRASQQPTQSQWATGLGLLLGLLYATRGLAAFLIPAPFYALYHRLHEQETPYKRVLGSTLLGLIAVLALYVALWYLPHRTELMHVNRYHVGFQLFPKTPAQLLRNLVQALTGERFLGLFPYLARYSPVQFALALLVLVGWSATRPFSVVARCTLRMATGWLLLGWLLFAFVNYAPSRYYVLTYPALATLAAVGLVEHKAFWKQLWSLPSMRVFVVLLGVTVGVHFARGVPNGWGWLLSVVCACLLALAAQKKKGASFVGATLCVWAIANGTHFLLWGAHLAYTQRDANRWVAENLPPQSVLIGDCAPALCINNHLRAIPVIPDLCNDKSPLERFAGSPQVIAILDGPWKERWWREQYPQQVGEAHRFRLFSPLVSHPVGLYRVKK